ncbi:MAG: hypothetical protein IJY17_06045 [Alphaproteobacteria bacterium]|nr:hypothetical protein [Alphaproteobacteria bacterium]
MNKNISFCMLVLLGFFILIPTQALAEPYVFNTLIYLKALPTFQSVVICVFILGGFGLVGLSVGAIFGAVKWKWAAYLGFGLFISGMALSIVAYCVGDDWSGAMGQMALQFDVHDAMDSAVTVTPSE